MKKILKKIKHNSGLGNYLILIILCTFVILQFFLQTSFSIMEKELVKDFDIDAASLYLLSSSFFWSYIALQIPAGFLLSRYGIKKVCFASLLVMGTSCFVFGLTSNLKIAFLSRVLMGAGAASGFLAMLKSLQIYFEAKKFIFFLSLAEFFGMIGLACFMTIFSSLTDFAS